MLVEGREGELFSYRLRLEWDLHGWGNEMNCTFVVCRNLARHVYIIADPILQY